MIGMTPTLREYLRVENIGSDPKVHAAVVLIMSLRGSALLGPTQEPSVTALDQHLTPSDLIVLDDMTQEEESARDTRVLGSALLATHRRIPGTDLYTRKRPADLDSPSESL